MAIRKTNAVKRKLVMVFLIPELHAIRNRTVRNEVDVFSTISFAAPVAYRQNSIISITQARNMQKIPSINMTEQIRESDYKRLAMIYSSDGYIADIHRNNKFRTQLEFVLKVPRVEHTTSLKH